MTTTTADPRFFTLAEIAEQLRISVKTIRRWIERGELYFHRLGRRLRISEDDLLLYLAKHRR